MNPILAATEGSNSAIVTFTFYIAIVMFLAWLSNRLAQSKAFLSEYFLGSRSLGMWAFALTFAATSASGGSFIGFPSLVYTHGWVVGLWIGGYMVVPLVAMGLLGKRLNQMARKTGSITIPDVLRDRFESVAFGALATFLIVFFIIFNLIAQFKGGSLILQSLLDGVPLFTQSRAWMSDTIRDMPFFSAADPGYLICLLVFSVAVIIYTAYGGFRAVVWTDVMQGLVMVGGVALMLPLAISQAGGLRSVTSKMAEMTPPKLVSLELKLEDGALARQRVTIPKNSWLIDPQENGEIRLFRTKARSEISTGLNLAEWQTDDADSHRIPAIEITFPEHIEQNRNQSLDAPLAIEVVSSRDYASGASQAGTYVSAPGPHPTSPDGFLPLSLAVSFFFMWTFSGAGQPSNMVRLMAFKDTKTLRRSIFTVSIYFTIIYFPLVLIFCSARVLLPGWETESDRIMPEMARILTFGINMPWLAGLLVAAPFAAVMSTMDSFLLMISSALVRDVYQRNINPEASERALKRLSHAVTLAVGTGAMLAAVSPPQFLQDIIVFTGTGLSTSFLVPMSLALYWPRYNRQGAFAGMLGGFCTHIALYVIGYFLYGRMEPFKPLHFHPFLFGAIVSATLSISVSLRTRPPSDHLVRTFFCRSETASQK